MNIFFFRFPCTEEENYKYTVLKNLPNLKKLDSMEVTEADLEEAVDTISLFHHMISSEGFGKICENFPTETFQEFPLCRTFKQLFFIIDKACVVLENFLMKKIDDYGSSYEEHYTWRKMVLFLPIQSLIYVFKGCQGKWTFSFKQTLSLVFKSK